MAFGTLRGLYPDPASLQKYSGVAPIREKSGNQVWTHSRWQTSTFLRQTFVEWAGQTVLYSDWAKVYYQRMIKKGKKHAMILRAWPSNGSAACGDAGKTASPTTRLVISNN